MFSYSLLWKGDRLPTVGVLQALLNRAGKAIEVDGIFGQHTHAALVDFQRQRQMSPDGIADKATWERLLFKDPLPLIDVVDVFDESILQNQAAYLRTTGGSPILMGGMSNGIAQLAQQLSTARNVFLLRIVGHGCPGVQAITMGKGGWIEGHGRHQVRHLFPHVTTSLNVANTKTLPGQALRDMFGDYGSVELHGCHVAAGPVGHRFIRELANLTGVPVTAGTRSQRSAIRFDGPTFTALPHGLSLSRWCATLPGFTAMTVP